MLAGFAPLPARVRRPRRPLLPRGPADHPRHRRRRRHGRAVRRASPCCPTPRCCTASTSCARRSPPPAGWSPATGTASSPTPPACAPGMAKGKYDAYLLMPRGARDEEFHNAITDLLSDWGSTVPDPEVVAVKIISPTRDGLTLAIRDFLDRMGMPSRVYDPDTDAGRYVLEKSGGEPAYPLVCRANGEVDPRHLGARRGDHVYGAPTEIDLDARRRRRRRRRRPGRPRRRGLRRVGGPLDRDPRGRGDRRPGRHQLDDPQLPRLPARHLRDAAGPAGPQPGTALRRPVLHRPGRRRAATRPRRRAPRAAAPRAARCAPARSYLQRGRLPQAAGRADRGAGRDRASTTAPR